MRLVVKDGKVLVAGSLNVELVEAAERDVRPPVKSAAATGKSRPSQAQAAVAPESKPTEAKSPAEVKP